jgi:hypothetical protein
MQNSLRNLSMLVTFLFLANVAAYSQELQAALQTDKPKTEEPTHDHHNCSHDEAYQEALQVAEAKTT